MKISEFIITGITCEACIKLITRRVTAIKGVKKIEVSLSGETKISADNKIDVAEIIKVLEGTDYQVN